MRRRVAIAAVVLAGVLAAWWWSSPETASAEAIGADGGPPPQTTAAPGRGVKIHATVGTTTSQARSVFTGRVSSSEDRGPIPHATVTFFFGAAHDAITDETGSFRFEAPRPGTYELRRVAAEGFAPYEADDLRGPLQFVARPGAAVGGIELELVPLVDCTGTVFRDGEPVAGAWVGCSGVDALLGEVTTGADGAYAIRCTLRHVLTVADEERTGIQGAELVRPDAPCRWDAHLTLEGREERTRHDRTLNVRVIDGRGRPVPRAVVSCRGPSPGEVSGQVRYGFTLMMIGPTSLDRTDESGLFQCRVPEDEEAIAFVPGVPGSERRAAPDVSELTLEVPSVGQLRGRVRDFDGEPVPSFEVSAQSGDGQLYRRPFISADGTFDLGEVIPGEYKVTADRPGFPPSDEALVEVSPAASAEVTLTLQEGRSARGVVLDAVTHRPIAGARIASPTAGRLAWPVAETRAFTTTDLNGRFAMSRIVLVGGESLVVSASGYVSWELGAQEILRGDVTIELTPTSADAGTEYGGVGLAWKALVVERLAPGGPAERAGVAAGDRLIRIDGEPADEDSAIARVRGPPGTMVELGFDRQDGGELDVSLRRERIPNPW